MWHSVDAREPHRVITSAWFSWQMIKQSRREKKKMKAIWHKLVRAGQLCQSCNGAKL